ncbi:putative oxidoreductase [Trypanosoma conorhini]|uniref:Putative oxidoreductase n=1 Tax=Trypanosoma conorhini TaxID=83891 RepID=A0A3R7MDG0_9TRYP|nr:putative oxidoreductase [Trypanosoma conorhini]RNF13245.1 putative oxidoreductase [Trypanosoma conorhini]
MLPRVASARVKFSSWASLSITICAHAHAKGSGGWAMMSGGPAAALHGGPPRVGVLGAATAAQRVRQSLQRAGLVLVAVGAQEEATATNSPLGNITEQKPEPAAAPQPPAPSEGTPPSGAAPQETAAVKTCTYDELVACREVDVVYVALPLEERDEWVKRCIRHRKHVLLSIPAAPSAAVLQRWMELANSQRLFLADGAVLMQGTRLERLWGMFSDAGDGDVGPLRAVRVCCSSGGSGHFSEALPATCDGVDSQFGVLGNLGWMAVATVLHGMQDTMPTAVLGRALQRDAAPGCSITEFSGELLFPAAGSQEVTVCMHVEHAAPASSSAAEQFLTAYGTAGSVTLHDLIVPVPDEDGNVRLTVASHETVQGEHLRRTVRREREVRVAEAVECTELPWRRLRDTLAPRPHGRTPRLASRFVTSAAAAAAHMRRSWSTQAVIDAMLETTTKTMAVTKKTGDGAGKDDSAQQTT